MDGTTSETHAAPILAAALGTRRGRDAFMYLIGLTPEELRDLMGRMRGAGHGQAVGAQSRTTPTVVVFLRLAYEHSEAFRNWLNSM